MNQNRISGRMARRSVAILALFLVFALVIIGTLFDLQILNYEKYQNSVLEQITIETRVNADRGMIYDRNGKTLATNATVWLVFISPQDILDAMAEENAEVYTVAGADGMVTATPMNELIARRLSEILEVDYDSILAKAAKVGRRYEVIKSGVEKEKADEIRSFIDEYNLTTQIYLVASATRYYPYTTLASHAIGFVNSDGVGIYGLERYYNNILEGTGGKYVTAQDAKGDDMAFEYETYVEAENGYNLMTTLDIYIQYELENQLKAAVIESQAANRACGIVMNPKTGEIYAMATYPSFDLNKPYTLDSWSQEILDELALTGDEYTEKYFDLVYTMWNNKAVTELYEPGSTFKILTTAISLDENVAATTDTFRCTGSMKIQGYSRPISCHKKTGHGTLTFGEALQQSCNPAMMTIASRIGRETFYDYFKNLGYAEKTGIDVPGESSSYYHAYKDFTNVSLAVYSFGQTFKTTPIQQLTAICSIANGGYLVTPHLMKAIVDDEDNVIINYETNIKRQVLSAESCATIAKILEEGVSGNGGAKNAYVPGYKVAAKTGTSEKKDKYDANGETSYRVASCVAFAPYDDPQVAVIIMVDEPTVGSRYGSTAAAPYVANLLSDILPYMGVEPDYTPEELKRLQVSVGNYVGSSVSLAEKTLAGKGMRYEIVGDGEFVTSQLPASGSKISSSTGKVILYTGGEKAKATVVVPNLIGKTAEAANKLLIDSGLNICIEGTINYDVGVGATVVSQSPAAGTVLPISDVVTVRFMYLDGDD